MQVIESIADYRREHAGCVATIGKYDGMHLGHQRILRRLLDEAGELELPALVILSEPQPEEYFAGDAAPPRLSPFWDKVEFLREFGVDLVFRLRFDRELSLCSAQRFVDDILVQGLGVRSLVVGDDFRFGRDRRGDIELLQRRGAAAGFRVQAVEGLCLGGRRVSSTLVRQRLQEGDFAAVREMLGRSYCLSGEVIRGRQLGRQLGVPTANLRLAGAGLPFTGVFAVSALFREHEFTGVANIGYRPTVSSHLTPSLEVHLFDFDADLYGASLKVCFLHKLRDERKFDGLEALKNQIALDLEQARAWFREREALT